MTSFRKGLTFDYMESEQEIYRTEDLYELSPKKTGTCETISLPAYNLPDRFGLIFRGFIRIPKEAVYKFTVQSNDGSKLFIDDRLVVDNDGWHGPRDRYGQIALKEGYHAIKHAYFQSGGRKSLQVFIESPEMEKAELSTAALVH